MAPRSPSPKANSRTLGLSVGETSDPHAWFTHEFGPMSAVADYANDPPRGMTNPPMNLKLREVLHADLVEYGVQVQGPHWGKGFIKRPSTSPSPTNSFFPLAHDFSFTRPASQGGTSREKLMGRYSESVRTGQTLKHRLSGNRSMYSRSMSSPDLGASRKEDIPEPHPEWHQYHPFPTKMHPIDRRGPPSLNRQPSVASETGQKSVHFLETPKSLEHHLMNSPSPVNTEFIKTPSHHKAVREGKQMTLDDPSGRSPAKDAPGIAGTPKSGKDGKDGKKDEDPGGKRRPFQKELITNNQHLANGLRTLKTFGGLHKAAVKDRFRYGASAASGEPLVLQVSSLNQANPGCWASDASSLIKLHNSAVRAVTPTGLIVNKDLTPAQKKKQQKKEKQKPQKKDPDGHLCMGQFVARYPVDPSLICLRKVRRRAFPEEERERVKEPTVAEQALAAAEKFKLEFGGTLLSRVRESDETIKEKEAAVAASGY